MTCSRRLVAEGVCSKTGRSSGADRRVHPRFGTLAGRSSINVGSMERRIDCYREQRVRRRPTDPYHGLPAEKSPPRIHPARV
jgi:hypothetical protein